MKTTKLHLLTTTAIVLSVTVLLSSCGKTAAVKPVVKTTGSNTPQIVYSLDDTLGNTSTELWSIGTDGTSNKKIPVTVPSSLHFEFNSDIAAEISTDNKTMTLSFENGDGSTTYFYKSNIDGSNVQAIPNINGYIYLQTFINPTSILYWKNSDGGHNGELWKTNTDGTGNQKLSIALSTGLAFGDGKFAKVTSDGKTVVFSTTILNSTLAPIYKCNVDGSALKLITNVSNYGVIQALINDTVILYYVYSNNGADQLWLVNIDGTNNHQLSLATPAGLTFADSRELATKTNIYFVTQDAHDAQAIYSAGIDGSNVKLLATVPAGYAVKLQGVIQ